MKGPIAFVHPSNLLTYLSLAAGIGAIAAALGGSADGAGACLASAALADTFDGRFARAFTRTPELRAIGMHLDSLSDGVAFGIVPVAAVSILLAASSVGVTAAWWIAATVYAAAVLTRLAFFNVMNAEANDGFIGMPAPVAALIWSTILLTPMDVRLSAVVAILTSVAMIAPLRVPRPTGVRLFAFALWPITLLIAHLGRT